MTEAHVNVNVNVDVNVDAADAEHDAVAGHGAVAVNANDCVDDRDAVVFVVVDVAGDGDATGVVSGDVDVGLGRPPRAPNRA